MPNPQNLIGHRWGKDKPVLSHEEAVKHGKNGGLKRAKNAREYEKACDIIKRFLNKEIKGSDGNLYNYKEAGLLKLVNKFVGGDPKATELVLKMIGEMPSEKTEITGANGTPIVAPVLNILPISAKKDD